MTESPSLQQPRDEREAFEKQFHFDFTKTQDEWGRTKYAAEHVESIWYGWKTGRAELRASLEAPLREPQQWIPVSARLPEGPEEVPVLVRLPSGPMHRFMYSYWWHDDDEIIEKCWQCDGTPAGPYYLPLYWYDLPPAPLAASPEAAVPMQAKERAVLRELLDAEEAQFPPAEEGQAVQTEWANRRHNAREAARALLATAPQSDEGLAMQVDAQWLDRAVALIHSYAAELTDDYDPSEARMDAAYKALHAHLESATKGTP